MNQTFEVIVVGGGHAGTEAALAAARMGSDTLLITHNIDTLGQMSCNPSIGGIGKGHLVKEIDALGGVMALAADHAGIQFRILNQSKGEAVQATRAQVDRQLYKKYIRNALEKQVNLSIFQDAVDDILLNETDQNIRGVVTQAKITFYAPIIILTNGTFLDGKIHIGLNEYSAGRAGDPSSKSLALKLKELKLPQGRLKTGTPPRLDARTIDFSVLEEQLGDIDPIPVFSFLGDASMHPEQRPCWITHTNSETHDIIRSGLDRSPLYTGVIEGVGPRYCPSIEDKIHRFSNKESHQIFLEPEGLNTQEIYPNGVSTSLPFDIQLALIRSIKGLQGANIVRSGYAIEYDYYSPTALKQSLESKNIKGLFFAGQVNGTTGYEEAAAQGLLAGINAALKVKEKEPWYPSRNDSYIGVMIDDLTSKGVLEPYRMFTSRAEFRLFLREDNADSRLTELGYRLGCVDEERWRGFNQKKTQIEKEVQRLKDSSVLPQILFDKGYEPSNEIKQAITLYDLARRPELNYTGLKTLLPESFVAMNPEINLRRDTQQSINAQIKYSGYIERQQREFLRTQKNLSTRLPKNLDYQKINGLSMEIRQKLAQFRPETLGQAGQISGITPSAIAYLLIYLKKNSALISESADLLN